MFTSMKKSQAVQKIWLGNKENMCINHETSQEVAQNVRVTWQSLIGHIPGVTVVVIVVNLFYIVWLTTCLLYTI